MNDGGSGEKVHVVITAAGNSVRFGSCKFLMPFRDGKTFLESIVEAFDQEFIDRIWIVTSLENLHAVRKLDLGKKAFAVLNPEPGLERFHSVQLGLQHCEGADFIYIHNADMPDISREVVRELFANRKNAPVVVPAFEGKNGHPVLIGNSVARKLLTLPLESTLREGLKAFDRFCMPVNHPGILTDVDLLADYELLMSRK